MRVMEFLDKSGARYEVSEHPPVFSSQGLAAVEHESGKYVAKPVIVKADGRYVMCVLPASRKVDLAKLKGQLGAKAASLASEDEIGKLFSDCELGAEPPFGNLYDLTTLMDRSLEKDDHILFQAGTHGTAVRLKMADYRRLVQPRLLDFAS